MESNLLMVLFNNPSYIKEIKKEDLNEEMVSMLETSHYDILNELIAANPYIVLYLKELNEEQMSLAINSGLKIEITDFEKYKNLRDYAYLFSDYLNEYPSIIKYFKKEYINFMNMLVATTSGYVPCEQDIYNNPDLRNFREVMEPLIKKNPNIIKLVSYNCPIHSKVLEDTFQKVTLTKEDFENNPDLSKNAIIYEYLPKNLKMYSIYFDEGEKVNKVVDALNGKCEFKDLPFFNKKLGAKVSAEIAEKIKELSMKEISTSLQEQESYLSILHTIIEACANLRYKTEKSSFVYKDIVALFRKINLAVDSYDENDIEKLKKNICEFIYPGIDLQKMSLDQQKLFSYVDNEINIFKEIYEQTTKLTLADTSVFCNNILNRHRNRYLSNESKKIAFEIATKFDLTEKKERLIINKYKLYNIREFIVNKEFEKINIDETYFLTMIRNVRNEIINNKKFIKTGIVIDEEKFERLEEYFIRVGELELNDVFDILKISDKKVGKYILRKYNNIRLNFLSSIDDNIVTKKDFDNEKERLDVNQLNFIVGNEKNYKKNLAKILLSVDEEKLFPYLQSKDLMEELNYLLIYSGIFKELTIETVKNIINNVSKVENIVTNYHTFNSFFKKIDDIIVLSNGYAVSSDINRFIISEDVLFKLPVTLIDKYLEIYIESLKQRESYLPRIKFRLDGYKYSTAYRWEQDKLLIGRLDNEASCIDLASGGEETYKEVLLKKTGSVIIIRKNEQEAVGRIFLIRRGNVVQIVVNKNIKLDYEVYKNIAEQLIYTAIKNNDNIDYVVINSEVLEKDGLITISDSKFVSEFPHADLDDVVTLLLSKNQVLHKEEEYNFDFEAKCNYSYPLERKRYILDPSDSEVNRILAINASLMGVEESNFEPYYDKLYETAAVGEDWFLGIKKSGEIIQIVLPLGHPEVSKEIKDVKKELSNEIEKNKKIL